MPSIRSIFQCSVCAALFVASAPLLADEDIYFSDLPIVASVSRLPQKLADAATSVTVIDRDIIKASGARDLNDLFRLVPGFQTFSRNTESSRVSYHGLTEEDFSPRVQVLIDGRSQYSPLFRSGVNWSILPVALEDIERIEVVRGTNSVSYGSNAFLGVINIVTVDPALAQGFSVSTHQGAQGVNDSSMRTGGKLGEAGNFRFTYQQKNDHGLTDRGDWTDSFKSQLFDLRADFQLTPGDVLSLSLGQAKAVMPQGKLNEGTRTNTWGDPIHDFSQSSAYFQLLWRRVLSADSDLQIRYAYGNDRAHDRFLGMTDDPSLPGTLSYFNSFYEGRAARHEVEIQHTFSPMDETRLVWGGSYRLDHLKSSANFYGEPELKREVSRVFGNFEWKPRDWFTGNLGGALEDDSMAGKSFSPRLSANFHLNGENTIRLGYAKSRRTGSIVDYWGDRRVEAVDPITHVPTGIYDSQFYGNPQMPQERLETVELGYLGDWHNVRMSLDVRLFQEKIPNRLMSLERTISVPGICEMGVCGPVVTDFTAPAQKVRIEGLEYQWRWQPFEMSRLMLSQSFTRIASDYSLNDPNVTLSLGEQEELNNITRQSAPRRSTSLLWMQKLPYGFELSMAGYWQSSMKWTLHSTQAAYTKVDARLAYPFKWGGVRGEVAYVGQNLNGAHGEFKAEGTSNDRIFERRDWLMLRLDL